MLADKKIWSMLGNPEQELTNDYIRLMLIELFSRLKRLETDNYAMKVILLETGIVSEETYEQVLGTVKDFFRQYDKKKEEEVDFYSKSGISFTDWVSFITNGRFKQPGYEQ